MKVLVTGGAGFIGSHFVDLLIEKKEVTSVIVVDALTYAGSLVNLKNSMSHIDFVHADIRNLDEMKKVVPGVDVVVNFAAETHNDNSLGDHVPFLETNIIGTANLLQIAAEGNIRFHQVSTDEVFGDFPVESEEEWDSYSPYQPSSPYSASKASADHLVRAWVRSHGLSATISICSNNYGARQHSEKLIPKAIKSLAIYGRAPVYGNGQNIREWIHVKDHVEGIWATLEHGESGSTYLFGTGDRVDNATLVKSIAIQMGKQLDAIEFVEDRKGHDRRYAINSDETHQKLGWRPRRGKIVDSLEELVSEYE